MNDWKIVEERSSTFSFEALDSDDFYHAYVRRDGCVDFERYHNFPHGTVDEHDAAYTETIHFCSLDKEIDRLQRLRAKAREHFGDDWETFDE